MWPANASIPPPPVPPMFTANPAAVAAASSGPKNDIFVGNLAFNTTEEQLHQAFSDIGRVINVRLVTDVDTGKPRGFAFVEFQDAQAALSAIRNMNDYELNGRRLRVNFSNSSHLEDLAGKLGMDLSQAKRQQQNQQVGTLAAPSPGTSAVAEALKAMSKAEMYDVVAKLKELDAEEARRLLASHPQLPEAILFCMSKLDMVKTPVTTAAPVLGAAIPAPPIAPTPQAPPRDPRQAANAPVDPRAVAVNRDPRQAAAPVDPRRADPRLAARTDPRADPRSRPPPPPPPQVQPLANSAVLDPALVQQVMSLTPQQIQQLPADKQQSILQLRQQITGGR
ncbi:cleavage stimulation factor subunit 2 [Fistulifera solaris]|uniref:Cleavage stimulation factor subunit 2 n=1 Tax=Fistulifera solaris TaxID=1519565 RepID=A0A1Z5JQL1_FISSO|nr:cleavage stimulation factor subunit 2 [Fistulifera solaris]|eukprot:GAX16304.1 cleavage stimulation factor subunit 2 [Fistulifera solaris]